MPTQAAIEKISKYAKMITKPAKVLEFFKKEVFKAEKSDLLKIIIPQMKKNGYTNIPIYDEENTFLGILSKTPLLDF